MRERVEEAPRVLLLGDPVAHSLSPSFQNAAFEALGLECRYEVCRVTAAELPGILRQLREGALLGANITLPHKEAAAEQVDRLGASASWLGAVNTWVPTVYGVEGHNTDLSGLRRVLEERLAGRPVEHACVLGAGGTARAAVVALEQLGCARITLVNRTPERAQAIAEALAPRVQADLRAVSLEALCGAGEGAWRAADLVLHTTSLGVGAAPETPAWVGALAAWSALPWAAWAEAGAVAVDASYGRHGTPFVAAAQARGLAASDGLDMLLYQGVDAFALWTSRTPPEAIMRQALYAAAGRPLATPPPDRSGAGAG